MSRTPLRHAVTAPHGRKRHVRGRYEVQQVTSLEETSLSWDTGGAPLAQRHLWFRLCRLSKPIVSSVALSFGVQWHTHTIEGPIHLDPCQQPASPYIDENLLLVHIKCIDLGVWGRNETAARIKRYAHDLRRCSPLDGWVRANGRSCADNPASCEDRPIALTWRTPKRGVGRVQLVPDWLRSMRWEAPTPARYRRAGRAAALPLAAR
eukprot:5997317-Prymnesium_polylepis.2